MLQVGVCDEEKETREAIRKMIDLQPIPCKVILYSGIEEVDNAAKAPDILFYSVKKKKHCEEELQKLCSLKAVQPFLLIFLAESTDYALQAFDMEAFHYILKPIEEEVFHTVFHKALKKAEKIKKDMPLIIKMGTTYYSLPKEDIFYAENNGRKIIVHTQDAKLEFYEKMDNLEKQLAGSFFRSHRGYLVSLAQVAGYDNCNIYLKNGDSVYLAKRKYAEFTKCYMEYLKR